MTEYTPSTEDVREGYASHAGFDRWLAEHDRQVIENPQASQAVKDAGDQEPLQVYMVQPLVIQRFREWVTTAGWHLQGPFVFENGDVPTYFIQPLRSERELQVRLRGEGT